MLPHVYTRWRHQDSTSFVHRNHNIYLYTVTNTWPALLITGWWVTMSRAVLICYFLLTISSVDLSWCSRYRLLWSSATETVKCLTSSWQVYWSTMHMHAPNWSHYYHCYQNTRQNETMRMFSGGRKFIKICKRCWGWKSLFYDLNRYNFQ